MPHYEAVIVRIWRSNGACGEQWTARVEHIQQGVRLQFTDIDELLAYLRRLAAPTAAAHTQASTTPGE